MVERGRCKAHALEKAHARPNADVIRWYNTRVWRKLRAATLLRSPLCVHCEAEHRVTVATDVDHIDPHRGDWAKFTDLGNLQALCRSCHSRKTKKEGRYLTP